MHGNITLGHISHLVTYLHLIFFLDWIKRQYHQGLKDDPSLLEDWKNNMDQILVKAQGNQKRSSDRMVLRHENKHPPSAHKKGDGVIVELIKNDKKIKEKGKTFIISKGKVLERSNNRYKIKYKVGEIDKSDWFPVSMITSETRAEEIKRK